MQSSISPDVEKATVDEHSQVGHTRNLEHHFGDAGEVATDAHGHPLFHVDPKIEARLRRKIDFMVVPTVALLYLFCFIDRANIGNAKIAGMPKDLKLKGFDYNTIVASFYAAYIVAEIPSNICCKWLGPGWFIPAITVGFGIMSVAFGYVQNKGQAIAVRALLGVFEAGSLPGIAYYLSRWYTRAELSFRLSLYIVMVALAGAFGSFLASGILKLDHFGSATGWRMIFVIEGIVTTVLGLVAFITMTDSPDSARWLTQEEKDIVRGRLKAERVGTSAVVDKMDKTKLTRGIFNPVTIGVALCFMFNNINVQGMAFFLPSIIANIYSHEPIHRQQLLTAPPYLVGGAILLVTCYISWKLDSRLIIIIVATPPLITGFCIFLSTSMKTANYVGAFLVLSTTFLFGSITNSIVSSNVVSDTARSSAIGTNVMIGNIGGLISTFVWLDKEKPRYRTGHTVNLIASCLTMIGAISLYFWMKADNKRREKIDVQQVLAGKSQQEIEDLDWKHPGFKWRV